MATNSTDKYHYFLNENGDIGRINGNTIENIESGRPIFKNSFKKLAKLSRTEVKFYLNIKKCERVKLYNEGIFKILNNSVSNQIFTIKLNDERREIKIIDKCYPKDELYIKFETKEGIAHYKPASEITEIIQVENMEVKNDKEAKITGKIRSNRNNDEKSIEDGFYIVIDKLSTCDSGSIIRVKDGIVIYKDDANKSLNMNDMERDKLDKIEENESNYLLKYKINERMEKHKNKIFNKIKELKIGDECYYKNDSKNIYNVKQKNIRDKGIEFVLQSKNSLGYKREINADAFDIGLIENDDKGEIYILTEAKYQHQIGTMFRIENGVAKSFPDDDVIQNQSIHEKKLRKIDKFEANFLKMFPINKRMKKVKSEKFKKIKELNKGDKCYVNGNEHVVNGKYFLSNELKFDLSPQKPSTDIIFLVDASEISLQKKTKLFGNKTEKNLQPNSLSVSHTSLNRQSSTNSGTSIDSKEKIKSEKFVDIYETIKCGSVKLKLINPKSSFEIDKNDSCDISKRIIVIRVENKQIFAKLLWKGIINHQICIGCEMLSDVNNGTDGTFNNEQLFNCKNKKGVLIPLIENVETCAKENCENHFELIANEIIKENKICCLKETKSFETSTIKIGDKIIYNRENASSGICKWIGLINGKECVAVVSDEINSDYVSKTELAQCINISSYEIRKAVMIQISNIPPVVHCKPINLNVINPYLIRNINNDDPIISDKLILIKYKQKCEVVKLLWKGTVDENICFGCEIHSDWPHGTNGSFNEIELFKCRENRGVLIVNREGIESCESKDSPVHGKLNEDNVIKENDICCLQSLEILSSKEILKGSNLVWTVDKRLKGRCEWTGLINGEECVGILCDDHQKFPVVSGNYKLFEKYLNISRKINFVISKKIMEEKLYFIEDKIVDLERIFSIKSVDRNYEFGFSKGNPVKINCENEGESMIGEIKWFGIINNEKCVGLDMEKKFNYGMDGYIDKDNKFECEGGHGLVTSLENVELHLHINKLRTFANGLIDPNQYIKFDEKYSPVGNKYQKNENVFVKLLDSDDWLKGAIRWLGQMNGEQVVVIELEENHANGTNGKFWRKPLFQSEKHRAVATRLDNINKYIPLKYYNDIFVKNTNLLQASIKTKDNDKYKLGDVIRINVKPNIYGEISFFLNYYDQELVGIIVDIEKIHLLDKIAGNILFQTDYFDHCSVIIVKLDSIEKCKEELQFLNDSRIIDTKSIVCKISNHSNNFRKDDVVKLNTGGNNIFHIIIEFLKLNGEQCVEVNQSILSNGDKFYLREIDICKIDQSDWEMKYFQHTIIDPSSIIKLEECTSSDFEIGNKVKFNLNDEKYELFEGVIKFIGKANNIWCAAVQLVGDKIADKNNEICKYQINQNETFHSIWRNSNLPIIFIPLNILKLQDNIEYANGIPVVDPKFVKRIEGMKIDADRTIIFLCEGKNYFSSIKWKGIIDKKCCLGCEIDYPCEFGTDGKFGDKILFTCPDKHGILIPADSIDGCCEIVGHQNIVQYDSKIINPDNICCVRTDQNIGKDVKIYLNDQIKRKDINEYPICRWLGYVNNIKCVGVDLKYHVNEGTNGTFCGIRLFQCQNKYGALYRLSEFISKNSGFKLLPDIGLYIVYPFNIKSIENGKRVEKLMNFKCNERNYSLNIKWRGCVDGELCIGCELMNDSTFGTDGTFAGQKIFNCLKGKGVLIPVYTIDSSCEEDKHNKIEKYSDGMFGLKQNFYSLNPDCMCCVEPLKYVKSCPSIQIGSRIKYVKGKQSFDGVCEWIGFVNGKESIGAKMKESSSSGTNGQFNNFKLFNCKPKKGFLFLIEDIKHDIENEKLYFHCDKIVDINGIYSVSLLDNPHENKKIGSPVITVVTFPDGNKRNMIGEIKWIGKVNNEICVGLDMEDKFEFGMNGKIYKHHNFVCDNEHGMITLLNKIELLENIDESHFCKNGIINPNKYLVCKENVEIEFPNCRNVKLNEFVFVLLKYSNGERKRKGILRWCGKMNKLSVCIVELNEEHELGTNGRFWRTPLIKCGNKKAIAVLSNRIYPYEPYESMIIPENDRLFKDIDINSAVKYYCKGDTEYKDLFGTVRWSGKDENGEYLYGIELDDRLNSGTDGQFNGQRLFNCQNGHGLLAAIDLVLKDSRFIDLDVPPENIVKSEECENKQSSILTKLCKGLNKGIQGNANSCYFDSAIFALFVKCEALDFMIDEINNENETNEITKQFRRILSFKIIYPLRKFGFVSFHRTNEMRDVIVQYGPKFLEMTKQESDMENVSALLSKLCPNEQLLSIVSHSESFTKCMFMQLFLTLGHKVKFMTSEEMLKISMVQNDIMFNELPTCLIMQAPRDARGINCYEFVLPMKKIEISQVCSNYFKQCFHCKNEAVYQCKECIDDRLDISSSFICDNHKCNHNSITRINISIKSMSKVYLELKSIICIEKCHFVSYIEQSDITDQKVGNQWYFFDSMSSQSITNNYAIPQVVHSSEVTEFLNLNIEDKKKLAVDYDNDKIKRIVKDSYIFVYQNPAKTCY